MVSPTFKIRVILPGGQTITHYAKAHETIKQVREKMASMAGPGNLPLTALQFGGANLRDSATIAEVISVRNRVKQPRERSRSR